MSPWSTAWAWYAPGSRSACLSVPHHLASCMQRGQMPCVANSTLPRALTIVRARQEPVEGNMAEPKGEGRAGLGMGGRQGWPSQ